MQKAVILTGLRANNDLHIGNYFGALLPIIDLARNRSDEYRINLFVPDLHSFTTPIDHSTLYSQTIHNLKLYAAAGLPLDKADIYLYRQSFIPAHSELSWILDCFTSYGEMNRMTQFKDKSAKMNADRVSVGLFNYPTLMAADILLYGAKYVPVGDDQSQHLEYTRSIAVRMNNLFGELFTVPEPVNKQHQFFGKDQGLRIKDLVDPAKKMSKSEASERGIIFLSDDPTVAAKKIAGATTDSIGTIKFDPDKQPGITNLLQLLALTTGMSQAQVNSQWEAKTSYGELKAAVAEAISSFLGNFQQNLQAVNEHRLNAKLAEGEAKMNDIANQRLIRVQTAVGLRQ